MKDRLVLILLSLVIILLFTINGFILYDIPNRGTYGDMFGGVNALFSGLAFVGIVYTFLLQRRDLNNSKEDFKIHQFENNLNSLINSHLKIVEQLSYKANNSEIIKGREVFKVVFESKKQMGKICFEEEDNLGHYFRNIYRILKIISRESFKGNELEIKKRRYLYSNLLRSILSSYELKAILYWCIQDEEKIFVEYINKYSFLKHISNDLKDVSLHPNLKKTAFYPNKNWEN